MERINTIPGGYVRLVDVMGSDLSVTNAARVSFDKESGELTSKDESLIKFLAEHGHTSPFRHATLTFEVYAPLMIARQWWKHVVGSDHTMEAWNESSRRYVTEEPEFYLPEQMLSAPKDKKQGSGDVSVNSGYYRMALEKHYKASMKLYERAMRAGIAPEQARLFLPAYAMFVRWRWTTSLQSVAHFINLRSHEGAQSEIRVYADAVRKLSETHFPISISALCQ